MYELVEPTGSIMTTGPGTRQGRIGPPLVPVDHKGAQVQKRSKKNVYVRPPGVQPGSRAWEAPIITDRPRACRILIGSSVDRVDPII